MKLFRGKDKETWYYGNTLQMTTENGIVNYILWEDHSPPNVRRYKAVVDGDSIGQCIDLIDKNENLVFEGDIVKVKYKNKDGVIKTGQTVVDKVNNWEIIGRLELAEEIEVIGNIIDNPKLVKKGEKNETI